MILCNDFHISVIKIRLKKVVFTIPSITNGCEFNASAIVNVASIGVATENERDHHDKWNNLRLK